jgi:hypothetical protein
MVVRGGLYDGEVVSENEGNVAGTFGHVAGLFCRATV